MEAQLARNLSRRYLDELLEDTIPFWMRHAIDREHGGFLINLDHDGRVLDTDKAIWPQARFTWMLCELSRRIEPRSEWREAAEHGIAFLRSCAFDEAGRMFFQVTRDGRPLRQRRYYFTECLGAMAFAGWARISGDDEAARTASRLFRLAIEAFETPGIIPPKIDPVTRPMKGLGAPMILLGVAQSLRDSGISEGCEAQIEKSLATIEQSFCRSDLRAVLEVVGAEGEVLDHFDGRTLNPGHALEAAWFILEEARLRGDERLAELGANMVDWTWERGWDPEYGGLLYFVDLEGLPPQEYWHDMKFWWPHCEAEIATLLAYELTGDARHLSRHSEVRDWSRSHFADAENGEWYGYLSRTGRITQTAKGNLWKGPFHLPRMQLQCHEIARRLAERASD